MWQANVAQEHEDTAMGLHLVEGEEAVGMTIVPAIVMVVVEGDMTTVMLVIAAHLVIGTVIAVHHVGEILEVDTMIGTVIAVLPEAVIGTMIGDAARRGLPLGQVFPEAEALIALTADGLWDSGKEVAHDLPLRIAGDRAVHPVVRAGFETMIKMSIWAEIVVEVPNLSVLRIAQMIVDTPLVAIEIKIGLVSRAISCCVVIGGGSRLFQQLLLLGKTLCEKK